MISVATASWLDLSVLSLVLLVLIAFAWWFSGFWGRMWQESIMSRSVDRRFMRWQRFAFRGHYPLGHWRKPGSIGRLRAFVLFWRAFLVLIMIIWLVALGHRIMTGPRVSSIRRRDRVAFIADFVPSWGRDSGAA